MDIKRNVKKVLELLHVEKLRKHQQKPINRILNDQDTFVAAPTSAGKSLIYQVLAILHSNKTTLVIEPTIALMHDQVHKLQEHGISAKYLDSTQTKRERTHILNQFSASNINILYLTPERLTLESFLYVLKTVKLFMIVIDEAHCILDWGYGFREAYLHIGEVIDSLKPRPVISAFTATASRKDADEICKLLHMNQPMVFENDLYRKNLTYLKKSANSRHQKQQLMMTYLRKYHNHASIVYCNTRNAVDAVYEFLNEKYPGQVVKCHAEMPAKKRAKHELQFLSGEKSIMAATSAFGMGVDLGHN